jgi:uncharacterized integral membrane protein
MKPKNIVFIVLGVLFLVFLIQNTQIVPVQLFFWQLSMSRIILIILVMLVGIILGYVISEKRKKR